MKKEIQTIIETIAGREGVPAGQVRQEMQAALDEGFASADPQVRRRWQALGFEEKPTLEEFICAMALRVNLMP